MQLPLHAKKINYWENNLDKNKKRPLIGQM